MPRQVRDSLNPEEASDVKVIVARKASVCDGDVKSDVRVELIMDLKAMSGQWVQLHMHCSSIVGCWLL